jgi:hypothetical protein
LGQLKELVWLRLEPLKLEAQEQLEAQVPQGQLKRVSGEQDSLEQEVPG